MKGNRAPHRTEGLLCLSVRLTIGKIRKAAHQEMCESIKCMSENVIDNTLIKYYFIINYTYLMLNYLTKQKTKNKY